MDRCFTAAFAQRFYIQQFWREWPKLLKISGGLHRGFHHVCHHEVTAAERWREQKEKQPRQQKLLANYLVGMRRKGEFQILWAAQFLLCKKWCNQRKKGGEVHMIGVVYAWRSMNSCLLMGQMEKSVVWKKIVDFSKIFIHCGQRRKWEVNIKASQVGLAW